MLAIRHRRSDSFDDAFGFQCKLTKCAVATSPGVHVLASLAAQRGYRQVQSLEVLGVRFELTGATPGLLKFSSCKTLGHACQQKAVTSRAPATLIASPWAGMAAERFLTDLETITCAPGELARSAECILEEGSTQRGPGTGAQEANRMPNGLVGDHPLPHAPDEVIVIDQGGRRVQLPSGSVRHGQTGPSVPADDSDGRWWLFGGSTWSSIFAACGAVGVNFLQLGPTGPALLPGGCLDQTRNLKQMPVSVTRRVDADLGHDSAHAVPGYVYWESVGMPGGVLPELGSYVHATVGWLRPISLAQRIAHYVCYVGTL